MIGQVSWLVLVLSAASWASVRWAVVLSTNQRRAMWVASTALLALPAFTGLGNQAWVQATIWPLAAGTMAGEVLWNKVQEVAHRRRAQRTDRQPRDNKASPGKPGRMP